MNKLIESINFDFTLETFKGIAELNNYIFSLESNSDINKTYSYDTNKKTFELRVMNIQNIYLETEIINIVIKYLEILGLEDFILKINHENTELIELLDNLEIDYTIDETIEKNNNKLYYEIIGFDNDNNEIKMLVGKTSNENISLTIDFKSLNQVLKANEIQFKKQEIDIYVASESNTMIDAMIIGTNLKDLGFKTEINTEEKLIDEQIEIAKNNNATYIIVITEENMKKYSINLIDAKTNEEKLISINALQDELFMNF